MSQNQWLKLAFFAKLLNFTLMCFWHQVCVETHINMHQQNLSYPTISLHRKEQPARKTTSPQSNTYNKDHFRDTTVLLHKGQGLLPPNMLFLTPCVFVEICS